MSDIVDDGFRELVDTVIELRNQEDTEHYRGEWGLKTIRDFYRNIEQRIESYIWEYAIKGEYTFREVELDVEYAIQMREVENV